MTPSMRNITFLGANDLMWHGTLPGNWFGHQETTSLFQIAGVYC